ncbi:signal peptide peptidase SppA [Anaeromyxobacter paludicola]|uniref:Multidrug transporter n=1 Tax=Anaeromyxobacter paludicola TaxID=2918171 RepID=A0ABN6N6R2_9BACT|nr:signal peptide peptidase SppA [Anaeromyxobacter paludicola]BDG07833.1 multidrug transporter [Anaeromyxobacter paludicola]
MEPHDPSQPLPTTPVGAAPQWSAPPPPPPSWGPPPGWPWPPPRQRSGLGLALGVLAFLLLGFVAFSLLVYSAVRGEGPRLSTGPRIGIVEVKGTIGGGRGAVDSDEVLKTVKRYADDDEMRAVVVRIDSPGGSVAPSQEIYDELRKLVARKKAVVCSMGNMAASGGFYVAMACPVILAEPGTLTGSIGVISQFPNLKGLAERFDVRVETIKSGKLKDAGNPFRDMNPDDRVYWQSLVDQVYLQFVAAVSESRHLPPEEVKKFADGRVLTGETAHQLKLVDALGNFNDAVDLAKRKAGLKGEPHLVYPPEDRAKLLDTLLGNGVRSVADAVRSEVAKDAMGAAGPGLYYLAR